MPGGPHTAPAKTRWHGNCFKSFKAACRGAKRATDGHHKDVGRAQDCQGWQAADYRPRVVWRGIR